MIKKSLLVLCGVGLLTVILFGRDAASYLGTGYDRVTESARAAVPTEFQIERARRMVSDLGPEMRRCRHVIAKEEVEVERLTSQIERAESQAAKDKSDLSRLHADLATERDVYQYAGHRFTAAEVKQDMARRLERMKTTDATLASFIDMRDARLRNLEAARKKLMAMAATQRQLAVEVENLEAKLKLVEVAETSSDFNFDNSKLARAKDLIAEIRTDLDVAAKLASADVDFSGEIPLDDTTPENIEEQVANYLGIADPTPSELAEASYEK